MRRKSTAYRPISHLTNEVEGYVLLNEADPLGIVWHGNYIKYFEQGREAFGRQHGINYLDVHKNGYITPIVNVQCDYKMPLKYGDQYKIITKMLNCPGPKIILSYQIHNQNGALVCEGQTTQVFVNLNGDLALYIPKFYEDWKMKVDFK